MGQHALTFSELLNRLRLIGVQINTTSQSGWIYLFGKKGAAMPWTRGPVYPIKIRPDDDLIPAKMIQKIMKHLALNQDDQTQFWDATSHPQVPLQ